MEVDAGAYSEGNDGHSLGEPLSALPIDASLDQVAPGAYNEWRVRGATPVGLFAADPADVDVRLKVTVEGLWGPEEIIAPVAISLTDVRSAFPGQPIWTMTAEGPLML